MTEPLRVNHIEPRFDAGMTDRVVVGLITLSTDVVTESELREMLRSTDVCLSATRIKTHNPMTISHLAAHAEEISKASVLYDPPDSVNVFAYACTSGSAIISQSKLEEKLHRTTPRAKLTSPMTGALRAFQKLGINRISMLTPYPDDVTAAMVQCLANAQIEVASAGSFHIETDYDVVRIAPDCVVDAAREVDVGSAEALFIPCTGFRTSTIIENIEKAIGKPTITAHQAMLWDALRLAGFHKSIEGLGKLFLV
jgi:maleate isomerase